MGFLKSLTSNSSQTTHAKTNKPIYIFILWQRWCFFFSFLMMPQLLHTASIERQLPFTMTSGVQKEYSVWYSSIVRFEFALVFLGCANVPHFRDRQGSGSFPLALLHCSIQQMDNIQLSLLLQKSYKMLPYLLQFRLSLSTTLSVIGPNAKPRDRRKRTSKKGRQKTGIED